MKYGQTARTCKGCEDAYSCVTRGSTDEKAEGGRDEEGKVECPSSPYDVDKNAPGEGANGQAGGERSFQVS